MSKRGVFVVPKHLYIYESKERLALLFKNKKEEIKERKKRLALLFYKVKK